MVSTSHPPQMLFRESDLSFNSKGAESCWSEILQEHKPNMIVGCIYRHPSSILDNFISQLENLISSLHQSKHQVFILGDMNIDFLKVGTHSKTEDYLDMLYSSNLLPVIKPTRITSQTLIDHIYTNISTDQTISGIVAMDISVHLPTLKWNKSNNNNLRSRRRKKSYLKSDAILVTKRIMGTRLI